MKISTQFISPIESGNNKNKANSKFKDVYKDEMEKVDKNTKEYSNSTRTENSVDNIVSKHMDEKIKKDLQKNSKFYEDGLRELRNLWGYGNFDKFS